MNDDQMCFERRRGDFLFKAINLLFMIILGGLTWWMSNINAKADRVPVLEERLGNLQTNVTEIKEGVKELLARRGK